ncbi:MAG: PqqD family protein [Anaerolineales bacterium]|nr:PqqD family protein [Anaerolineales bacterium]
MTNEAHHINTPKIVHETIEGEVVIINLDNGAYYSLDQAGAALWGELEGGAGTSDLAAYLEAHYAVSAAEAEAAVNAWVAALIAEELVRRAGPAAPRPALTSSQRSPFVTPALNKHTDMQDLLLLDPIHEVDETGWPSIKA